MEQYMAQFTGEEPTQVREHNRVAELEREVERLKEIVGRYVDICGNYSQRVAELEHTNAQLLVISARYADTQASANRHADMLKSALQEIVRCDTAYDIEGDVEFFDGIYTAEETLKRIARKALNSE